MLVVVKATHSRSKSNSSLGKLLSNKPRVNKRRRRERSRDDRSQLNHIPLDLALEILSRLPAKLLVRSLYVSKLWSSFIILPSFIHSFTSRSTSRSPTLMVTLSSESEKYVLCFPTHQIPNVSTYSQLYSYEITNLDWQFSRSNSIQGLILAPGLKIWNPTLRRLLALPHPGEQGSSNRWSSCLGWSSYLLYDPLVGKHKVLCVLTNKYSDQPRILTLGAQGSWRIITKGRCPKHSPTKGGYGRCFNGILYYTARLLGGDHYVIMRFDVKSKIFNTIKLPGDRSSSLFIIPYEGRLAIVTHDYPYDVVKLYSLKDAHGHEWTSKRFVLHLPCENLRRDCMLFRGITDAGEFIFAPCFFKRAFYILYLDPRRNSTREVFFERNMGEFRRRCGLHRRGIFSMEVFPNHIESLFSL